MHSTSKDSYPNRNLARTIRYIGLSFACLAFVLIVVSATSLHIARQVQARYQNQLANEYYKLELVNRLFDNKEQSQILVRADLYTPDPAKSDSLRETYTLRFAQNTQVLIQLDTILKDESQRKIIRELTQEWTASRWLVRSLQHMQDNGDMEGALGYLRTDVAPFYMRYQALVIKLNDLLTLGVKQETGDAIQMVSEAVTDYAFLLLLAFFSVILAAYLLRRVFKQLHRENKTLSAEICERQALQKTLLKKQEDYRNLFDGNPIPSLVYDQNSLRILDANAAALKEYGYSREEFLAMTVADIRPEEELQQFLNKLEALDKSSDASTKGYKHQRKDGSTFSVELRSHALPVSGEVFPRLVVAVNMQNQEEALERLSTNEKLLREVSSSMPGAVYQYQMEVDGNFSFPYISEGITALCSVTPEEVYKDPLQLYKYLDSSDYLEVIRTTLESYHNLTPWEQEIRVWRPELKKYTWVRGHSLPTRKPNGAVLWNGTFIDITNQKEAQERLHYNEANLRALLDSSLQAIFLLDEHLKVIDFNKEAAADVKRYLLTEVQTGRSMLDYVAPAQVPELQANHARAMQGESIVYEQGQGNFWHELAFQPVVSPDQSILGVALSIRNISAQKKSFETIKRNELQLARAQQLARLGSWEFSVRYDELTWSSGTYDLFGVAKDGFSPTMHNMLQRIHPEDRKQVKARRLEAINSKQHLNLEYRILLPNNQIANVQEVAETVSDETGAVISLYGTVQDITDRKKAEQEITEAKNLLQKTIENIPEIIFAAKPDLSIIYISPQCEQITGYPETEFIGESNYWMQAVHSTENLPLVQRVLPELLAGKAQEYEMRLTDSVGRIRWLLLRMSPETGLSEGVTQIYGSASDMTAYKEAETRQQELSKQLMKQNLNLQQFAYIVSHNLRAPIANILGLTSIYNRDDANAPINKKVVDNLVKSTNLLDSTIRDLNDILTIRSEVEAEYEHVEFNCLMQDVLDMLKLNVKHCELELSYDFSAAPSVNTVRSYAKSILQNLLSNAIKYKFPDRKPIINVYTLKVNNYICLRVEDNGLGIDLEKQKNNIFGLYKRFHKGIEGKGIGLHLVKTQVEMLGGKVTVDSIPQKGTTFSVYFKMS
ncbi:PAS domain S-box protein [Pontibacter sp. CAU 1760]